MTDKQIMIDGIDVSGCLFHSLTTMGHAGYNYCKCFQCVCECHKDCHYKLYKRKEQECEILLGQLVINDGEDVTVQISQSQFEEYNQLKAENEILKQYKASKQASYESMQREWNNAVNKNRELKAENEELKNFHINLVGVKECEIRELASYKQAVEKIKEICTKYKEICANCEGDGYIDCIDCTEGGEAQAAIKVLQICDEVKDVQDNL